MIQIKSKRSVAIRAFALAICSLLWLSSNHATAAPLDAPVDAPVDAPLNQGTSPIPPTISIQKQVLPATDPGRFDLLISNNVIVSDVGDGGFTGGILVSPGGHVISEVAAPGFSLGDYNTTINCVDQFNQPIGSISNSSSLGITVALNQRISCTILNVRKNALQLTMTDNDVSVLPGGALNYELTYSNVGAVALSGVQIVETVPTYASFDPDASSSGWICQSDGGAGSQCTFSLGTVEPDISNNAPILFAVKVDPIIPSSNVTTIRNVARIVDESGLNVSIASETTPLNKLPILSAIKDDSLLNDADGNGIASPGDTISYRIKIENSGESPATSIMLTDSPDPYTTLNNGSINTSKGIILQGNNSGDSSIRLNIGTLLPGASVTIFYNVSINDSLPATVTQLQNQAIVTSNELPAISTDDPGTLTINDPTIISLLIAPHLLASQIDSLAVDKDGDGFPSPGDTILMEVVIANTGNGSATNVFFSEPLDPNIQLVADSLVTTQGTIIRGSDADDSKVELFLGLLAPSTTVVIRYEIEIKDPLPTSVTAIQLQGIVSGDQIPDVLTDDLALPAEQDPTSISIRAIAAMSMTKRDLLFVDADKDNSVSINDILLYRMEIVNNGNAASENLILEDVPPTHTTLIVGSVQTDQGRVLIGNANGDSSIQVDLGSIAGGGKSIIVTYQVRIDAILPVNKLESQATLKTSNTTSASIIAISDDPDTGALDDVTITMVRLDSGSSDLYMPLVHAQ